MLWLHTDLSFNIITDPIESILTPTKGEATMLTPTPATHDASPSFDKNGSMCYLLPMRVEWEGKVYEFEKPMAVSRLLEHFSLSREAHLVVVNDALVTEDCKISRGDRVRVIRVVSGG
jgi:sulfur carrier protein ThiS